MMISPFQLYQTLKVLDNAMLLTRYDIYVNKYIYWKFTTSKYK
jgi:hypothetical protein